ncbi:MAG: hypothetical protein GXP31_08300 [Kiritimatiellaeota bacterium]|nr:hypothetical protein [Kiritimatiellota bacterium]
MKANPAEAQVRQRMAPGVLSRDGFLGTDSRNIADIVAEDRADLDAAGVTAADIARVLEDIHRAADAGLETSITLCDGAVRARGVEVMGRIPCPFGCGVRAHKAVITVEALGKELRITPILIHLIGTHGFFQGRGSPFRIEPAEAIALWRLCGSDASRLESPASAPMDAGR